MEIIKVYYLEHPEKNMPVYVGATKESLSLRLKAHNEIINGKDSCSKLALYLREKGLEFRIVKIDEVPLCELGFWRQYWSDQFRAWGFRLIDSSIDGKENVGH